MPNRLANEPSPYLRQHALNPVDWFPWGDEALLRARSENLPIFLSIGYSACHWCHVMAHESFENEEVAALLNSRFVCIKVDRQERPDLDSIYMAAVQALTGGGGWPMSVFLTPEGEPFYGGTYFPPTPRHGLPSFTQVLLAVAGAWRDRRQEITTAGRHLVSAIREQNGPTAGEIGKGIEFDTLRQAFGKLSASFDWKHGGWGSPQKFPQPMVLEFLLRYHRLTQDSTALDLVTRTLDTMARSALYDQLGGGFHRYCVNQDWSVPHFEKMLYDNAQLARVYLHAWQITGEELYRSVVEETLDCAVREMTDPRGGFFSAQDADSEGEEGKFFVWSLDEVKRLLDPDATRFAAAYSLTQEGNFEGRNTMRFLGPLADRRTFSAARRRLLEARENRIPPARDEQVVTSWNGLMLAAFSEAARAMAREDYRGVAERCAGFLLTDLWVGGRLSHTWRNGVRKPYGFLADYACLLEGLIELYQTTFHEHLVPAMVDLADTATALFGDEDGGFYDGSRDDQELIVRPRDLQDNAVPSGSAMATSALLRLGELTRCERYVSLAANALSPMQPSMARYPLAYGQWLQALCFASAPVHQVAIVGSARSTEAQALLEIARSGFRPFQVVAFGQPSEEAAVPLLDGRSLVEGRATAYVCSGPVCLPPVSDAADLLILLDRRQATVEDQDMLPQRDDYAG